MKRRSKILEFDGLPGGTRTGWLASEQRQPPTTHFQIASIHLMVNYRPMKHKFELLVLGLAFMALATLAGIGSIALVCAITLKSWPLCGLMATSVIGVAVVGRQILRWMDTIADRFREND